MKLVRSRETEFRSLDKNLLIFRILTPEFSIQAPRPANIITRDYKIYGAMIW
jgi:hypothetical protein